jgi:hypothetical protein
MVTFKLRLAVLVPFTALLAACGGGSSPTSLTPTSAIGMSPVARSHLTQLLDIMQANSMSDLTVATLTFADEEVPG